MFKNIFHILYSPHYTEGESGIDIARAIKYVRYHVDDYGISPDNIRVIGFSAGGNWIGGVSTWLDNIFER